jgi:hypothetical protein
VLVFSFSIEIKQKREGETNITKIKEKYIAIKKQK